MKPAIFEHVPVTAASSSLVDGEMKRGQSEDPEQVTNHRDAWLKSFGSSVASATLVNVRYGDDVTYDRILDVGKNELGGGMIPEKEIGEADALFTGTPGQTLFLPLADCGGAVLFDAEQKALGLLHLGRHSTFDHLAEKSIRHMEKTYGTNPENVFAWISPAISGESYWLEQFDLADNPEWQPHIRKHKAGYFVDLQGYNIDTFIEAGVLQNHIERSPINTATDSKYPSHYVYKTLGQPEKAGRFAVAAYIDG